MMYEKAEALVEDVSWLEVLESNWLETLAIEAVVGGCRTRSYYKLHCTDMFGTIRLWT